MQPFVYKKAATGEESEGCGRHRPARRVELSSKKSQIWRRCCRQNGDLPRSSVAIRDLFKNFNFYRLFAVQRENFNYHNCTNKNGFKPSFK